MVFWKQPFYQQFLCLSAAPSPYHKAGYVSCMHRPSKCLAFAFGVNFSCLCWGPVLNRSLLTAQASFVISILICILCLITLEVLGGQLGTRVRVGDVLSLSVCGASALLSRKPVQCLEGTFFKSTCQCRHTHSSFLHIRCFSVLLGGQTEFRMTGLFSDHGLK